jgi:hypothetical protein
VSMQTFSEAKARVIGWPDESEIPPGVRLNLGCGRFVLPNEQGWVNVDYQSRLEGVDVNCNLFEFPWPFKDNYADYMIASHLVEHIPHEVMVNSAGEFIKEYKKERVSDEQGWKVIEKPIIESYVSRLPHPLDGFFAFFGEVWRVLKPGGIITVIVPDGRSDLALQDPTHTRYIVPATFSYLAPGPEASFDYGIDFRFETLNDGAVEYPQIDMRDMFPPQQQQAARHWWNVFHTLRVDLRAIKPLD